MDPILLAAVVHDLEPRVELAAPDQLSLRKGERPRFRVSFRLADHASAREEALLEVDVELADHEKHREVAMHDHLFRDDETWGSLEFEFAPPPTGQHVLRFKVSLRTSVKKAAGLGATVLDGKDAEGSILIEVS